MLVCLQTFLSITIWITMASENKDHLMPGKNLIISIPDMPRNQCDEIAQMVEQRTVKPEVPVSNPAASKFFCAMLQRVTNNRVFIGVWCYKEL